MDERRHHPRTPLRVQTEVRFSSWEMFRLIYTINISHGGMSLEIEGDPPAKDSKLTVKLELPAAQSFALDAVVRHAKSLSPVTTPTGETRKRCQVGIEFEGLDDQKKALIEQAIEKHVGAGGAMGIQRKK